MNYPDNFSDLAVLYVFSVAGATLLWMRTSMQRRKVWGLHDVIQRIVPNRPRAQYLLQFATFILFGGMIALVFTAPATFAQAIAGGIAWSQLGSSPHKEDR